MNFTNPHFAEPVWLWLAFLGPMILAVLQLYARWARRRQLAKIAAPGFLEQLTPSHSPARRGIKNVLLLLTVAGVGMALARPQWGEHTDRSHSLGHDILFALDCSNSMLASDVAPTRLQRAKLAMLDFMHRNPRGRLGLVAFAGQAFLQCPLTYEYGAFEESLMALDEKTIPIPGTDIGSALDEAFRAMRKSNRQKLLILLTDGEDLEKGGVRIAETLAKQNVVVFTVGVGTPAGAEIQVINEQGRQDLLRDSKGEVVRSRLDETTLRAIAQATGGAYYPLGPLGEGLAKVQLALESLETPSGSIPSRTFGVDRYQVPLAAVLFFFNCRVADRHTAQSSRGRVKWLNGG
jgi:Ca-activated chloride channel homolog